MNTSGDSRTASLAQGAPGNVLAGRGVWKRWTRKANRCYYFETEGMQAVVFGAPERSGLRLWAWAVYWNDVNGHGSESGVEHLHVAALLKAEECMVGKDAAERNQSNQRSSGISRESL